MTYRSIHSVFVGSLAVLSLAAGCGKTVADQSDAGRGMQSMMKALNMSPPASQQSNEGLTKGLNNFRDIDIDIEGGVDVNIKVDCPEGGDMELDGRTELTSELGDLEGWDAYAALALQFELNVAFDKCEVDGVKMDGDLTYALGMDIDTEAGTASVEWSYLGEVRFRGDVSGRCEIDMTASASTGEAFTNLEVRAYSGSMCGFDAEDISAEVDF